MIPMDVTPARSIAAGVRSRASEPVVDDEEIELGPTLILLAILLSPPGPRVFGIPLLTIIALAALLGGLGWLLL